MPLHIAPPDLARSVLPDAKRQEDEMTTLHSDTPSTNPYYVSVYDFSRFAHTGLLSECGNAYSFAPLTHECKMGLHVMRFNNDRKTKYSLALVEIYDHSTLESSLVHRLEYRLQV